VGVALARVYIQKLMRKVLGALPMPTWLITGTSGGLGRALAEHALEAGHQVVSPRGTRTRSTTLNAPVPKRRLRSGWT
jgi:NAD(P)-dependent dehydrogenase (short-subunit alcohol dehydrogenase family)